MMLANANGVVMTKSLTAIEIAALNGDGSFRVDHGLYLLIFAEN